MAPKENYHQKWWNRKSKRMWSWESKSLSFSSPLFFNVIIFQRSDNFLFLFWNIIRKAIDPYDLAEKNACLPSELRCFICKKYMKEAVMIPCCHDSFCDKCELKYLSVFSLWVLNLHTGLLVCFLMAEAWALHMIAKLLNPLWFCIYWLVNII